MKNIVSSLVVVVLVGLVVFLLWPRQQLEPVVEEETPVQEDVEEPVVEEPVAEEPQPASADLTMAYIHESPDHSWTGSWKNACEEAAIAMVDHYYQGADEVGVEEAMMYMQRLFDVQVAAYGSDRDSDAARTLELIEGNTKFGGTIVERPTLEAIQQEIDAGRPVIAFHRGFELYNENIPFLRTGSSYHATVIKGYDDAAQQFIIHDTGDPKEGADHRYDYDLFMNSLHDYNYISRLADGPARVIFTFPAEVE